MAPCNPYSAILKTEFQTMLQKNQFVMFCLGGINLLRSQFVIHIRGACPTNAYGIRIHVNVFVFFLVFKLKKLKNCFLSVSECTANSKGVSPYSLYVLLTPSPLHPVLG